MVWWGKFMEDSREVVPIKFRLGLCLAYRQPDRFLSRIHDWNFPPTVFPAVRPPKGVDYMPSGSNRIIRFCGWWLDFFVHNCTCGRFHTVTFETVSLFFSYIYLRIPSYLGPRGEPPFFRQVFFAVQSNAFIRIHISRWFCSMGHSWILVRIHTN